MARGAYAKGKWATGECARSGRKMLLRNMIADGYYPNLIVDPQWYEPKHPQEALPSLKDPVTLFRPAPDRDRVSAQINLGGVDVGGAALAFGYEVAAVGFVEVPQPPDPTEYNDPSNWTLIQKWDTRLGDMADMVTGMGGQAFNSGFAWSYDGTKFTLCNVGAGSIFTFTCSTPFDPDTTGTTPTLDRTTLVPSSLQFNDAGSRAYAMRFGHDFFATWATSSPFVVGASAESSFLSKGDVGFTGIAEGGFILAVDDETVLYQGTIPVNAEVVKQITLSPPGDLFGATVIATESINPPVTAISHNLGMSVLDLAGGSYYECNSSIVLAAMSTPGDLSTLSYGSFVDINTSLGLNFLVVRVWINPNNTEEIWVGGTTSGFQVARLATNV